MKKTFTILFFAFTTVYAFEFFNPRVDVSDFEKIGVRYKGTDVLSEW